MSKKQKGVFEGKLCYVGHDSLGPFYELGRKKARLHPDMGYAWNAYLQTFCKKDFETLTGIKLKLGEEVMVKITIETTPIKKVKK